MGPNHSPLCPRCRRSAAVAATALGPARMPHIPPEGCRASPKAPEHALTAADFTLVPALRESRENVLSVCTRDLSTNFPYSSKTVATTFVRFLSISTQVTVLCVTLLDNLICWLCEGNCVIFFLDRVHRSRWAGTADVWVWVTVPSHLPTYMESSPRWGCCLDLIQRFRWWSVAHGNWYYYVSLLLTGELSGWWLWPQ